MDKRLLLELIPGPAFLAGYGFGGIFLGAAFATAATAVAIALRWRWDRSLPLMAISILVLTLALLAAGLFFDDPDYVKAGNTIGSLAFAAIIGAGMLLRPSLLQRTLGHSVRMTARGWRRLHQGWIALSLARAGANELVWRTLSDRAWALYNGVADIAWIGAFMVLTFVTARRHWEGPQDPRLAS
jgi:intracellular septation protein